MPTVNCSTGHRRIIKELSSTAESYLEIGVQEGASLQAALAGGKNIRRLLLCDTWDRAAGGTGRGTNAHIAQMLKRLSYTGTVEFLDGKSQITLPRIVDSRRSYDLSSVDGGHTYDEALADMTNVWKLTRCHMVVHDISFTDVWRAVSEFGRGVEQATVECSFADQGTVWFSRQT